MRPINFIMSFAHVIILMGYGYNTYAMIPVVDVDAIAHLTSEYYQLEQQTFQLSGISTINDAIKSQAETLVSDSEGHYGYGAMENSDSDVKAMQYSADSWDDALKGLSGGNDDRYQQLLAEYQQDHPTLSSDAYSKGSTAEDAQDYQDQVSMNSAAATHATYEFNDINSRLDKVNALSKKIDEANNTKAAVDLNSRLTAELAYIQVESLKMQSILNQQMAGESMQSINDESQEATYSTLPPDNY